MNKSEEKVKKIVEDLFLESHLKSKVSLTTPIPDDMVLLDGGLDSLGFAVLVTKLEMGLGYDPFTLMEDAVYPVTYREFVNIYVRFSDHFEDD